MTHPAATDPSDDSARPYGVLGLVVSLIVIQCLAAVFALLAGGLAFAVLILRHGSDEAFRIVWHWLDAAGTGSSTAERLNVVVGIATYVVESLAILVVARFRGGPDWSGLVAWRDWRPSQHWRLFLPLLAAALGWSVGASIAIEYVYPASKDWVTAPKELPWIIGFLALTVLFGPIAEELLFRGWIYTSLRSSFGLRVALLVTSVLFALAHWESTHLYALAVFPVGLAITWVREKTQSIAASITFHAIYNGVASVLLLAS